MPVRRCRPQGVHRRHAFGDAELFGRPRRPRPAATSPNAPVWASQARICGRNGKNSVVLCQYSNPVGFVAMFGVRVERTIDPVKGCETAACRAQPWWRSEYVESDPPDSKMLQVCVIDRDGETFPSIGCRFVPRREQ